MSIFTNNVPLGVIEFRTTPFLVKNRNRRSTFPLASVSFFGCGSIPGTMSLPVEKKTNVHKRNAETIFISS